MSRAPGLIILLLISLACIEAFAAPAPIEVPIRVRPIDFKIDKRNLKGRLWTPPHSTTVHKGVVLVHMLGRTKDDWNGFAPLLAKNGFYVLAVDLRGKGTAGKKSLIEDIQSGVVYLKTDPQIKAVEVSFVAASIGANGAAQYSAATPDMFKIIRRMVLISPQEQFKKVTLFDALSKIKKIPTLLVASKNDKLAFKAVEKSKDLCPEACTSVTYPGAGQGTDLLHFSTGRVLEKKVVDFLLDRSEIKEGKTSG